MTDLTALGWDAAWAAAFEAHAEPGLEPARVAIEFNHILRVATADGDLQVQHAGRLLHRASGRQALAAVGDWVGVRRTAGERTGTIEVVLPRRTRFSRKAAGAQTVEQVVAANIDTAFIVMGLDGDYNLRRLERYLLMANESGAQPVVVLSKADLAEDVAARRLEVEALAGGAPVHAITAVPTRDPSGVERPPDVSVLTAHLGLGRTGALLGSSGVGKTTIINALSGTAPLKTRAVRVHDSRGRHTTRHRQLVVLPHGVLIDTPGMRELQLWDVAEASAETFDDIEALSVACHFTNCRHRAEPRCAVKAAVGQGRLTQERLASFLKLQDEVQAFEARHDERAQIEFKRRAKVVGRSIKQLYKDRGRT